MDMQEYVIEQSDRYILISSPTRENYKELTFKFNVDGSYIMNARRGPDKRWWQLKDGELNWRTNENHDWCAVFSLEGLHPIKTISCLH